jgi:hypothetical protein
MLTAIRGTYENGQISWDETPPVFAAPVRVIVTFLELEETNQPIVSETFKGSFPNLHRWVELDGKVEIGYDVMGYTNSLVMCHDEGGTVYMSPSEVTDIQQALELADATIREWMDENMPGELDD